MRYLEFPVLEFYVNPQEEGKRVDAILRRHGLSTSAIRRSKRRPHGLLVDGEDIYTSYLVHAGQVVAILADDKAPSDIVPNDGPVNIRYEDDDLLVVDKPPGLAVHPCAGSWDDSLGARLVHYYHKIGLEADFHPVHRLDKGTSGLMVVAKHPAAQHILTQALHSGDFLREYLAVCRGCPSPLSGVIDAPLGRTDTSYIRQEVRPDGKRARTHYQVGGILPPPPSAGDRADPPDPGPHGLSGPPPGGGLSLRHRGPGPHLPPRPPLGKAGTEAALHRGKACL